MASRALWRRMVQWYLDSSLVFFWGRARIPKVSCPDPLAISSHEHMLASLAPHLVAMGSFLNPDTTRIIAKRIILTGHPFKVHKKTATVRYMFFNRGMTHFHFAWISTQGCRWRTIFQTDPITHQVWPDWAYSGIIGHPWILQSTLWWTNQSNGHRMHESLQEGVSKMVEIVYYRRRKANRRRHGRMIMKFKLVSSLCDVCYWHWKCTDSKPPCLSDIMTICGADARVFSLG